MPYDFFDDDELAMLFATDKQNDPDALATMSVLHEERKAGKRRNNNNNRVCKR